MGLLISTRKILNDILNCITTVNPGNFQSVSRHLRRRYHLIHEAIATCEIEVFHLPGTEMLADALTKALGVVKLGEFLQEVGLQ